MIFHSGLKWMVRLLLLVLMVFRVEASTNTSYEHVLRQFLLAEHDKNVRPVIDPRTALQVEFGVKLGKLVKVNNKEQVMTTSVWVSQIWKNPYLQWKPSRFGNIDRILVSPAEIWVPDIVLYNNGDESVSLAGHVNKFQTSVVVKHDGTNRWMSPATLTSTCAINARYWPFDVQRCLMTFGSWTMSQDMLNLTENYKSSDGYADGFVTNGDWSILRIKVERNEHLYSCCGDAFSDVTFSITMRRKPVYYVLYLILPCLFLAALTLAGFHIPIESGERISFNMTILLGMNVYLLLIAGYLPETSDEVPLLGFYFIVAIAGITVAVLGTVVVLKIHFGQWNKPRQKRQGWSKKRCAPLEASAVNRAAVLDSDNLEIRSCYSESSFNEAVGEGGKKEARQGRTPQELAAKVDRVLFWLFLVYVVVCFVAVYSNASASNEFDE